MKRIAILPLACVLLISSSLSAQSSTTAKRTIRKIIMFETLAADQCNFEQMKSYWHKADYAYYSVDTDKQNFVLDNWTAIRRWADNAGATCQQGTVARVHSDFTFKIKSDLAFVTYREDSNKECLVVLELHEGKWKIIRKTIQSDQRLAQRNP